MSKWEAYENQKRLILQDALNGKGWDWYDEQIRLLVKELKL